MARRLDIDERLQLLRSIRDEGDLDKLRDAAVKALADGSNLIVAEAAKLIRQNEFTKTESELVGSWHRLMGATDRIKADRGCTAKTAIVEALGSLNYDEPDFYLGAISYEQMEPVWGDTADTAENVRGNAAFALARSQKLRIVDKLVAFVKLLNGPRTDQINAARAIADTGSESAIPLLHLILRSGTADTEALGACMSGLLELAPKSSMPLIVQFLSHPIEEVVLETAAALGQYGRPDAITALMTAYKKTEDKSLQRSILLSIGLSRDSSATDFLISRLESGSDLEAALAALKPACVYREIRERIRAVLEKIGDQPRLATFLRIYAGDSH